ncbi:hypothetical protein D6D27_07217 [Aureobasidium pullulans]|nr:hypothetical protein D6D27_07217 [Aureobasidium pullulans]
MGKETLRPTATKMPKTSTALTKYRLAKSSKSSEEKKDLITIRDVNTRLKHKFACNTCIQGHRAPLCDPSKHRNKILFRRPTPGRPARSCGHTHLPHCECRASRKLCCSLTNDQWDLLIDGGLPEAVMYDSQKALEDAWAAAQAPSNFSMYQYGQMMPYRPAPNVGTPMWPGPMGPYGQSLANPPGYLAYPPALPSVYPPSTHHPAYHVPTPWDGPNNNQVYGGQMNGEQMNVGQMHETQMNIAQMNAAQSTHTYTNFAADTTASLHLSEGMPFLPTFTPYTAQASMALPDEFTMDMINEERIAAQPSSNPTQSCCSSRSQPQQPQQPMMQTMQPSYFPTADPRHQFPCMRCASSDCTCENCPEVRQTSTGAWSQACGRGGHLDSTIHPKLEFTAYEEFRDTPAEQTNLPPALHQAMPDIFADQLFDNLMSVSVQDPMLPQYQGSTPAHLQGIDRVEELPDSSPCVTNDGPVDFSAPNGTMDPRYFEFHHQQ